MPQDLFPVEIADTLSARDLALCREIMGGGPLPCPNKRMGFLVGWFLAPPITLHIIFSGHRTFPNARSFHR
jgi:hypothetical protein